MRTETQFIEELTTVLAQALHFTEIDREDTNPVLTKNDLICWKRARRMAEFVLKAHQNPSLWLVMERK